VKATGVTAGLAESNGSLLPGLWRDSLHVTCGLTACTLGSAPGPTPGNEYGETVPFLPSGHDRQTGCPKPPINVKAVAWTQEHPQFGEILFWSMNTLITDKISFPTFEHCVNILNTVYRQSYTLYT